MNIWLYIFVVTFIFVFIKTVASFIIGDIDVDFDADGDVDFDISSMLSFKGILHFLLGISTYLSLIAKLNTSNFGFDTCYNYQWYHYVIGIFIGMIFMFALFKLYQLMMKFNHYNNKNPDFNNCNCSILINNGNGIYTVLAKTPLGTYKINAKSTGLVDNLEIGNEYKLIYDNNSKEYFLNN